jgi:hypothetical protein
MRGSRSGVSEKRLCRAAGRGSVVRRSQHARYLLDFDIKDDDGILHKLLLVDLLNIFDPNDIGGELEGVSEPSRFTFPFNSIERGVAR